MIGEESSSEEVITLVACIACERCIANDRKNEPYVIRMPSNITHTPPASDSEPGSCTPLPRERTSTSSICQCNNLSFSSQIPHNSISCTTGTSKYILDLLVPCDGCDFIKLRTPCARGWCIRFAWIFEIPDVDLYADIGKFVKEVCRERKTVWRKVRGCCIAYKFSGDIFRKTLLPFTTW